MKTLFVFLLSFVGISAFTQDNWKVCLDNKTLLNPSVEDEKKNTITISSGDLKKSKKFVVSYHAATAQNGWERTIAIYDEKDQELKKQVGKTVTLKASDLKSLFTKSKTLKIYSINLPTDPKLKAQVRVRRVHLCTLILQ